MIIDGQKLACLPCIRGHRVSNCQHTHRELLKVRPKGRPSTQCSKCRELRRTRKAHVKCICAELKKDNAGADMQEPEPPIKVRKTEEGKINSKVSSIESLLNPCHCKHNDRFCTCCKSEFSEFLTRTYPTQVVEQTAKTLTNTLKHKSSASEPATPAVASRSESTKVSCPSGPNASCCKTEPESLTELPAIKSATVQQRPVLPMPLQHRRLQPPPSQQRLPSLWNGSMQHQLPAPLRQPINAHHQQQPATAGQAGHAERPSCSCGCDCSKKLDMLIQAIEARIGLGQPLAPVSARGEPEWVRSVLSPVTAAPARARTSHIRTPSVGSLTRPLVPSSAPQTARRTSFGQQPLPAIQNRQRSVSASSASTSGKDHPTSAIQRQESFAAGVVPPVTWQQPALPTSVCGKGQPSLQPQQTLPVKSCCDGKARPSNGKCAAHCSGDCACCKQPKWVPGNAGNATVDADGALSCSCGCHKPFGECSDCIKDKCMGLYESNV